MKSFIKYFFASFLAFVVFCLFIGIISIGIISAISSSKGNIQVEEKSVLVINLENGITEKPVGNFSFNKIFKSIGDNSPVNILNALKAIQKAKTDDNIKGIILYFSKTNTSLSHLEELRTELASFRKNDKFIYAFADEFDLKNAYISSIADQICLNPVSYVYWKGLGSRLLFFKNSLSKLDVEMQIFYHGKYKSATEPYRNTSMSKESKEQTQAIVTQLYNYMLETICTDRNIPFNALNNAAKNLSLSSSYDVLRINLVDKVISEHQFHENVKARLGLEKDDDLKTISLNKYIKARKLNSEESSGSKIAIVYAEGTITDSDDNDGKDIQEKKYLKIFKKIEDNDDIKAVVLRVNSPGGDLKASDRINEAVKRIRISKPVIVSISSLAASGGYYISCEADSIIANRTSITGSIGIFAIIPNIQGMLTNKLGITVDGVESVPNSNFDILAPLSKQQENMIKRFLQEGYDLFKSRVASGRKLELDIVEDVAQGRVWTAYDAKNNYLIDGFGGLLNAIDAAKNMSNLNNYSIKEYPGKPNIIESLSQEFQGIFSNNPISSTYANNPELSLISKHLKDVKKCTNSNSIQARLPYNYYFE